MHPKIEKLLSLPMSLYASWRFCRNQPFWKLPLLVRWNTRLRGKGLIFVNGGGKLTVGFGNVGLYVKKHSPAVLEITGRVEVDGNACFGHGARICVGKSGLLRIGNNVTNTAEARIVCFKEVCIGRDSVLGWETTIMDTDFHRTINTETGTLSVPEKAVRIGKGVWCGEKATILKGCDIADGCIIAACAVVTKQFAQQNALIAGNPAMVKKTNVKLFR